MTDYVGKPIFEARAKEAGVVLYIRAVPSMNKGDTVASVGVVGKAPSSGGFLGAVAEEAFGNGSRDPVLHR